MERRDYIQKEIDQLGKVLAVILSKMLSLKAEGKTEEAVESVHHILQTDAGLDLIAMLAVSDEGFLVEITERYALSSESVKSLADILYEFSLMETNDSNLQRKALILYRYVLQSDTGVPNLDLLWRIQELQKIIA